MGAWMLLSESRRARGRALDLLADTADTATRYAVRDVLLFDRDAGVRARAAAWLVDARASDMTPALRDAAYDEMPLVRHAAIRALAILDDVRSAPLLARMALEEPIWWVRRAAVVALARVRREAATPTLLSVLDDPFWRVRHAAVRALLRVGRTREHVREAVLSADARGSARTQGALAYLRKRWTGATPEGEEAIAVGTHAPFDPDPAVVTARLERGVAASPAFLAECLGDSHEQLRRVAVSRLLASPNDRALDLALLWLEEPRIPHAAETVIALLDALGDRALPLVERALAAPRASRLDGVTAWAASYVALVEIWEHLPRLLRIAAEVESSGPLARRAAVAALGVYAAKHEDAAVSSALVAAVGGADDVARRLAAQALVSARGHLDSASIVHAAAAAETDVLTRRALVRVLDAIADEARTDVIDALGSLAEDADAEVRAVALAALAGRGRLPAATRDRARNDPDPWVRRAVLDEGHALEVLAADPDPSMRRAAFGAARDPLAAARLAWTSPDPFLRRCAAERLVAGDPDDLARLLRLSRDPVPAVRAAAGDALELSTALDALLEAALARETEDDVRMAAHTWLARRFDAAAVSRVDSALADATESATVTALLRAMADVARPEAVASLDVALPARPLSLPLVVASPRTIAGFAVSPLAISGASPLPVPVFLEAMDAGCNLFFWEPRHRTLGKALQARPDARVIAGSYEASARGIVRDVDRALSRLRRDALDIFLLFWTRSPERLRGEGAEALFRLRAQGKIRAAGFSTHDRSLACDAIASTTPWDVVMVRHSAAHPGAEASVFPAAQARGVSVLAFSALSYGRLLDGPFTAADCYRYVTSRAGVSACLSAPRHRRELRENLEVMTQPDLDETTAARLRAHGRRVHEDSRDFGATIRRYAPTLPETASQLESEIDLSIDPRFG